MNRYVHLISNFFKNDKGEIAVWQTPNVLLFGWIAFTLLGHLLPAGRWRLLAGYLSFGLIFTWSWLEITQGVSSFRRVLGAIVLFVSIRSKVF